jgi:hypothetical protein
MFSWNLAHLFLRFHQKAQTCKSPRLPAITFMISLIAQITIRPRRSVAKLAV